MHASLRAVFSASLSSPFGPLPSTQRVIRPMISSSFCQHAGVALNKGRGLLEAVPGFDYALRNNTKHNERIFRAQMEANNIPH